MNQPRLTPVQAESADAQARRFENATSQRQSDLRILDLLDERDALTARAEQAEKDRDTITKLYAACLKFCAEQQRKNGPTQ